MSIEEINLIPEDQVPKNSFGYWPTLFGKIPEGQSAVLTHEEDDIKRFANNIRSQLGQQKGKGKFKTLFVSFKGDKVYITNRKSNHE